MRYLWLPAKSSLDAPAEYARARAACSAGELCDLPAAWWADLRATAGGWRGVPAAAARLFDRAVLYGTPTGALARGQYSIACAFLALGKPVAWWDAGEGVLRPVYSLAESGLNDWKDDYAFPIFAPPAPSPLL